jgi:hypothetical protein
MDVYSIDGGKLRQGMALKTIKMSKKQQLLVHLQYWLVNTKLMEMLEGPSHELKIQMEKK